MQHIVTVRNYYRLAVGVRNVVKLFGRSALPLGGAAVAGGEAEPWVCHSAAGSASRGLGWGPALACAGHMRPVAIAAKGGARAV